jgi:AraC-like DNA-binding protein
VKIEVRARPEVPGVRATYFDADERLWCSVKDRFSVSLIYSGRSEWWSRGRTLSSGPRTIDLKQPNQVHKDFRRDGPTRFQIVSFDHRVVEEAARLHGVRGAPALRRSQLDMRDPDRRAFEYLHAALQTTRTDALRLETAVAEGLAAFTRQLEGADQQRKPLTPRPKVARAVEYIHAHLTATITLDALAAAAGLDRFHLCRAFREDVGLPPYAYAIEVRLSRARELLGRGVAVGQVAAELGFYDQSQLNRHFRRSTGVSPTAYARAVGAPPRPGGRLS